MKWGILVSVIIIAAVVGLIFVSNRGFAEAPTSATSPEKLKKVDLPDSLPSLYVSSDATGNAKNDYYRALNVYLQNKDAFESETPPYALVDEATNHLVAGMDKMNIQQGFVDDQVPMKPGASPKFGAALEVLPIAVLDSANEAFEEGNEAQAISAATAVFALGERAFRSNDRFYSRNTGLMLMGQALAQLNTWKESLPDSGENFIPWFQALEKIQQAWMEKVKITANLDPHVGDLINMARNDEDVTFRIAATLNLGVAKLNPGSKGNLRVIHEALKELKEDPNSMVAEAAEVAETIKKEDIAIMR